MTNKSSTCPTNRVTPDEIVRRKPTAVGWDALFVPIMWADEGFLQHSRTHTFSDSHPTKAIKKRADKLVGGSRNVDFNPNRSLNWLSVAHRRCGGCFITQDQRHKRRVVHFQRAHRRNRNGCQFIVWRLRQFDETTELAIIELVPESFA